MHRRFGQLLFWVWAPMPIVLVGLLLSGHLLTLPVTASAAFQLPGTGWRALHVLALKCACSRQVIDHLVARGAQPGMSEHLVLIGDDAAIAARVRGAGFTFEAMSAAELGQRTGIQGAPLLVVVDPAGRTVYSGGYSTRWRGPAEDLAIFASVRRPDAVPARPLFGCAVSRTLQAQLDPLGLKYP